MSSKRKRQGRSVVRALDLPETEPLTAERLKEIEDDVRLIATASVARHYVSNGDKDAEEVDEEDEAD